MAKAELGTKRVCPETGRKFYDLNRDPIVSPYTGQSYPLTFFQEAVVAAVVEAVEKDKEKEEEEEVEKETADVEIVSLEEADSETAGGEDIPDLDDAGVELEDDDDDADDTFLATDDDDDDDDLSDVIIVANDEDDS